MNLLKKRKKYIPVMLLLMLILLPISCQSSPEVTTTKLPPEIGFPSSPDPTGRYIIPEEGETAIAVGGESMVIDINLWIEIAEYFIDVDATKQKYREIRNEYSGQ